MDFHCIEMLLDLPELLVVGQVIRPHELQLNLERRDSYLVCPHCQGCCCRIKESRDRCIRDLPILDRPVTLQLHIRRFKCSDCHLRPCEKSETFGLSCHSGPIGFIIKYARNPARLSLRGTGASLWSLGPHGVSLDV